jgi:hypothetical protein
LLAKRLLPAGFVSLKATAGKRSKFLHGIIVSANPAYQACTVLPQDTAVNHSSRGA